jgi:hypothetical protein
MAYLNTQRFGTSWTPIIEDPNPSSNRIFINAQAYDLTTLANSFQTQFHYTFTEKFQVSGGGADLTGYGGQISLQNGIVQCWGSTDSDQYDNDPVTTYHKGLDFANYPVRRALKTINGYTIFVGAGGPNGQNGNTQNNVNPYYVGNSDASLGMFFQSTYGSNNFTHLMYEDTANATLWGLQYSSSDYSQVGYITPYEGAFASYTSVLGRVAQNQGAQYFFLGVDQLNYTWWLRVDEYNYNVYQIWKINPSSKAATQMVSNSSSGDTSMRNQRRWPSNIRRDSATRRVFYGSHFNSTGTQLTPIQYVISADVGSIALTTCTMYYPGNTLYSSYAASYTNSGYSSGGSNSYHMKPWQFSVAGTNYITFWPIDKSAAFGNGTNRWPTAASRTMMTYSIAPAPNDFQLTFHSYYTFPDVFSLPREIFPINNTGVQLAVPITGSVSFMAFNTSTGWSIVGSYPYEARQLGMDSTGRIWMTGAEKGYNTIHIITPSLPISVSVVSTVTNLAYTGTQFTTNLLVNAYSSTGTRLAATLNLIVDGASMVFTANGTKTLQVVTTTTTDTIVTATIVAGGISNIIVDANI